MVDQLFWPRTRRKLAGGPVPVSRALRPAGDGAQNPSRDNAVAAAPHDQRAVHPAVEAGKEGMGDGTQHRSGGGRRNVECQPVAGEAMLTRQREEARRLGSLDVKAPQRGLLSVATPQQPVEHAGPGSLKHRFQRVRQNRPDHLRGRSDVDPMFVEERERWGGIRQGAATTIVAPCPPPMQAEAKPRCAPRRIIS